MALLLGIDTGGTYTDAVLFDDRDGVQRSAKALTTREQLSIGIGEAAGAVVPEDPADVALVSISTTLATNAIVEGRGAAVCLLMIGQSEEALERSDLGAALRGDPVEFIAGGHDATGAEREALDADAAVAAIVRHAATVSAFAVAAHFGVRNPTHELALRDLIRAGSRLPVTCSHELSDQLDAPRRALTTLLNARLIPLIAELIDAVMSMMDEAGLVAPLMVVKGDGSLVNAEVALTRPVETILSGPAASIVGGRHLSGEEDVLVVDMGGTTSDIAVLDGGQPRLREDGASVGGWRTMVRAVAAHTVGLGGDSEVGFSKDGDCVIGPRRAVPMCLLAERHPEVLSLLAARREKMLYSIEQIRMAVAMRAPERTAGDPSRFERELCDTVAAGPRWVCDVAADLIMQRVLERLIRSDRLAIAAFTPTDAAHVLGWQKTWSQDAARAAAELWYRLARFEHGFRGDSVEAFCAWVVESVVVAASRAAVAAAVAHERAGLDVDSGAGRSIVERALLRAKDGDALVRFEVGLRRPLVALGAPASSYFPQVAERLDTELHVPEHAEVANAVGAVATGVMQQARILISSPSQGCYRVHSELGLEDFSRYTDSEARARTVAKELAAERARVAGAEHVQVDTEQRDLRAPGPGGQEVFVETVITATAVGRPRLGVPRGS